MIKIYGILQSRALRPLWALEEAEADYEFVPMDMLKDEHKSDWFRALNPACKVPAMSDDDFTLIESGAICQYIANKYSSAQLIPKEGSRERALFDQWMFYIVSELEQPLWTLGKHKFALPKEHRVEAVLKTAIYEFSKALQPLAQAMQNKKFLVGEQFTVADIMAGQTLLWALKYDVPIGIPHLQQYAGELKNRPAFKRVISKFGGQKS